MSKEVTRNSWTTYDVSTGRVVRKRDNSLSAKLLAEAENYAREQFEKLVKKGKYKENEFEKYLIDIYTR